MIDFSDAYARALRREAPTEPRDGAQPHIVGVDLAKPGSRDETCVVVTGVSPDSEIVVSRNVGPVRVFFADADGVMRELRVRSSDYLPRDSLLAFDPREWVRHLNRYFTFTGTFEPGPGWDDFVRRALGDDR